MLRRIAVAIELAATSAALGCGPDPADSITADGMLADVAVLSADSMEGRLAASPGEARATAYIARRFEEIGLVPISDSYLLPVDLGLS